MEWNDFDGFGAGHVTQEHFQFLIMYYYYLLTVFKWANGRTVEL